MPLPTFVKSSPPCSVPNGVVVIVTLTLFLLSLLPQPPPPLEFPCAIEDMRRFPPVAVIDGALLLGTQTRAWLRMRQSIEPWRAEMIEVILDELDRHQRPWQILSEVRCQAASETSSREEQIDTLTRLRKRIGWHAYGEARMPCPVPVWLFTQVD